MPTRACPDRIDARGMSLMETLFAALILSLTLVVLLTLFPSSVMGLKKAEMLTTASDLARARLEEVRGDDFDHIAAQKTTTVLNGSTYQIETFLDPVNETDPKIADNLKHIRVVVSWNARGGSDISVDRREYSCETTIFNFPSF